MKLKLITATILSLITINALAIEGHGFRIISEKVTGHGFINPGIQEGTQKKTSMGWRFRPAYASALTWTYNAEGRVLDFVTVSADHSVNLSNYTKQPQRYTYTYTLSCESAYQNFEKQIEILPGGSFSDSSHTYGAVQKESEGTFTINASTQVSGADSAWHEAHAILRIRK